VSIFASPYSDALCLQAVRMILEALPRAFAHGDDLVARAQMANGATIAGLAFANAFVGVNHALAHAVGARFGISHGRANALFLPHVLRYNAAVPAKFMPAPGYGAYVVPAKYAEMARIIGLGGREALFARVEALLAELGMPGTAAEAGVDPAAYHSAAGELAIAAFADLSLRTNPRMPLVSELRGLIEAV
jgi:acetaldehyde dehydrogenase/alcohol dehydrogenase